MGSEAVIDHRDLTHYEESFYSPGTRSQVRTKRPLFGTAINSFWKYQAPASMLANRCTYLSSYENPLPETSKNSRSQARTRWGRGEQTWFRARRQASFSSMIDGGLMRKDWRRLFPDRELFVKW